MPVPQLAALSDLERLAGSAAAQHERAEVLLDAASAVVRGHCGWPISAVAEREVRLDGTGGRLLHLPCAYVTAVHAVQVHEEPETRFSWSQYGTVRRLDRPWPADLGALTVTYSGGFTTVPASVIAVTVSVAVRGLALPSSLAGPRVTQETVGPFSWTYAEPGTGAVELTSAEQLALLPFRLPDPSHLAALA